MDATTAAPKIRFNRLLPYWAVLQTDLRQTLQSWVYRLWVLMAVIAGGTSLIYKVGVHQEAGIVQSASAHSGNMLRGLVIGSLGLVALLAVSAVGGERATVADAILSRGISRHQYFLAKWHSRTAVVLATFLVLSLTLLVAHHYLLDPNLSLAGGLIAVGTVAAALAVIVSWGVTIGALTNGTIMGITLFWIVLYGGVIGLSLLPEKYPTPDIMLTRLKFVLQGQYDADLFSQVAIGAAVLSVAASLVGMIGFSRKDV